MATNLVKCGPDGIVHTRLLSLVLGIAGLMLKVERGEGPYEESAVKSLSAALCSIAARPSPKIILQLALKSLITLHCR